MYWPLLLTSFLAVSIQGIAEETLQLAKCMVQCPKVNKSCRHKCDQYSSASEGPTSLFDIITKITNANVSLHCRDTNFLMIRHNRGIYVIEQGTNEDTWSSAKVTKGRFTSFSNLTTGTLYRYRLHRVTKKGLFQPELSPWFSTNEANYEPGEVKDISLERVDVEKKNVSKLYAEIAYRPANDYSCYYDVVWWSEYDVQSIQLKKPRQFRYTKRYLEFDQNNTIWISSRNERGTKTSNKTSFTFITPTCLEMHNNLSICAPREVDGLLIKSDRTHEGLHDITITWNEPELKPDSYAIQLLPMRQPEDAIPIFLTVPGNETEALLSNADVGSQYQVSIIAESAGGTSPEISIYRYNESQVITYDSTFVKVVVVLSAMTTIAISIGFACACCKRGKRTRHKKQCKYLESLDRKDAVLQISKDDNPKTDYLIESDDPFARMDEFEIRPDRLQIKEILGSGAFGIVRLGSMRIECGEVTDVAVKMPKDDPCADDIKNFQQEILMMKSAGQHPNIVSLIGCCTLEKNKPLLIVEYCHRGDLQTYLRTIWEDMMTAVNEQRTRFKIVTEPSIEIDEKKNQLHETWTSDSDRKVVSVIANRLYDIEQDILHIKEKVTATDLLNFSRQIAKGMEFLSLNRIVHRDLAARNVLVCSDRTVKISDFGLSRDVYQENVYKKQGNGRLPIKWMAIESLTHQMYTTQSDVWSFGVLLWEIVTLGSNPYPGTPANRVLKLLKSGYRMERPQNCGTELYNMMLACWRSRPQSRPTFTELKQNLDKLLCTVTENQYLNLSSLLQESVINNRLRSEQKNNKGHNRSNRKRLARNRYINEEQNLQDYKMSLTNVT